MSEAQRIEGKRIRLRLQELWDLKRRTEEALRNATTLLDCMNAREYLKIVLSDIDHTQRQYKEYCKRNSIEYGRCRF